VGVKSPVVLSVDGPLDTANPATNRAPGTLLEAVDTAHRWIGPRGGMKAWTWPGRGSTANFPIVGSGLSVATFDGTNTYATGELVREQADLGAAWTLDVCFHATANQAIAGSVPVFRWRLDATIYAIEVGYYGTGNANAGKVYAVVKTTSSAGVVGHTYTLVSAATVTFSSSLVSGGKMVRCFVRLTRDGTTLSMTTSTDFTAVTNTSLSLNEPHVGTATDQGAWFMASNSPLGANSLFKGYLLTAVLRSGAFTSTAIQTVEHIFPRAPNVIFHAQGAVGVSDTATVREFSRFGSHGAFNAIGAIPTDRHYPYAKPVQMMGAYTDLAGVPTSAVMVGGALVFQRAR